MLSPGGSDVLAHAEIAFFVDRGVGKVRVNLFRDGAVRGFIKPVGSFSFIDGRDRAFNREVTNHRD